jgi:hypothetical protein
MNPKPLVAVNHFTVPLDITSSPQDQKILTSRRSPHAGMPEGIGYAGWGTLDSSKHISIPAKNDHYRGAFALFADFAIISRREMLIVSNFIGLPILR